MKIPRFNWLLWAGFLLSFIASAAYPFVFIAFPAIRDFSWAILLLFPIAAVFLFVGLRRAFAKDRPRPMLSKIAGVGLTTLSALIIGLFFFSVFIMAKWLPASTGAPQVGQKAPDFSLADTGGRPVSLSELIAAPINGNAPKGVLLVFYRGYW